MLSLFRTNQAYAGLLLYVYALVLQFPMLWLPASTLPVLPAHSYFGQLWLTWLGQSLGLGILLPPVLVATAGVVANAVCIRYRFARVDTQFPGLMVVLLWALCPAFHYPSPWLPTQLFLILAAGALSSTYKSQTTAVARFNAGWWLGCASLFVPSFLLYVPCFILGISIFRTAQLRTIMQLLGGIGTAYFLAGTYVFLRGDFAAWAEGQLSGIRWGNWLPDSTYVVLGAAALLLPLAIVLATNERGRLLLNIEGRKNVSFVYWLLLFAPLVAIFRPEVSWAGAQVGAVPLGIAFGLWLVRQDAARAEFYHLLFFAAALTLLVVDLL